MAQENETQTGEEKKVSRFMRAAAPLVLWAMTNPKWTISVGAALLTAVSWCMGNFGPGSKPKGRLSVKVDTLIMMVKEEKTARQKSDSTLVEVLNKTRELYGGFERIPGGKKALSNYRKEREDYFRKLKEAEEKRKRELEMYGPTASVGTVNLKP